MRTLIDSSTDAVVVEAAVRQQVDLTVRDAVLGEAAGGWADADDLLEGVIRAAGRSEVLVPRTGVAGEGDAERMCTGGNL